LPDVPIAADFGFFGRMVQEKGVSDLLDALHLCRTRGHPFRLDLYGEGRALEDFQRQAKRLELDALVRWRPFVRGEELVRAMNSPHVVVVPSKWREPMGIVAVEAMACGKCVIGSSSGGLGEVLGGYCPRYPNNDVSQLADQMTVVAIDPPLRQQYEQAALRRSKDFELYKIANEYLAYFSHVIGDTRR